MFRTQACAVGYLSWYFPEPNGPAPPVTIPSPILILGNSVIRTGTQDPAGLDLERPLRRVDSSWTFE